MSKVSIDREKCIGCESCVKDCITYSLEMSENKAQVAEGGDDRCISCQHCFAICPTGAISFDGKNPQDAETPNFGNPDDLLKLIKSRRSVRQFKQDEITADDWNKIKSMLPYIPTGCNFNGLHFSFVESRTAMDKLNEYTRKTLLKLISNKFTSKYAGKFARFKTAFENGEDIIFRQAPAMIVVSSSIKAPCANVDPIIALSYIELYVNSLGLGTCWCGFAQSCFKIMPKLSEFVKIPDGYKPVYAMLIGYPSVNYPRVIMPEEFPITEISEIEEIDTPWYQKAKRVLLNFIR